MILGTYNSEVYMISVFFAFLSFLLFYFLFKEDFSKLSCVLLSLLISLTLGISIDMFSFVIFSSYDVRYESRVYSSQELLCFKDSSSYEGKFFLCSGSIDNKDYYCYYSDSEYGFKFHKIRSDDSSSPVYIKFITEDEKPRICKYSCFKISRLIRKPSFWLSIIGYFGFSEGSVREEIFYTTNFDYFRTEIFIPVDSVCYDFEIDME